MTEISARDFTKLTIEDVSELLLDNLNESDKDIARAELIGMDDSNRKYTLTVSLEVNNEV